MNLAHASYAAALAAHDDLVARLDALTLKASAQRLSGERDLAAAEATAREVLTRRPCPVAVATALVDAYDAWLTYASSRTLRCERLQMKCQQPGCTGTIVDGYCDVCGMAPAEGASTTSPDAPRRAPSSTGGVADGSACQQPGCTGTIVDGYCDVCGTPAGTPAADSAAVFQAPSTKPPRPPGPSASSRRPSARSARPARVRPTASARRRSGCARRGSAPA